MDTNRADIGGYQATPKELDQAIKDLNNAAKTNARSKTPRNGRRTRTPEPTFPVTSRKLTPSEIKARQERSSRSADIWERVADELTVPHSPIEHRDGKPIRRGAPVKPLPVTTTSPFGNNPAEVARKTPIRPASRTGHMAATARELLSENNLEWNGVPKTARKAASEQPHQTRRVSYGFGLSRVEETPATSANLNHGYGAAKGTPKLRHGLRQDR